jgi:hydroxymethylbilane synthase
MKKKLRLGTRRSALARIQSGWVAQKIEQQNPNFEVELVGLETQGDRIQHLPLSKMEGKDFFVKELDEALLSREVDLTVHSLKDLSLERPEGIFSNIIPQRILPNDIVFFHPRVIDKLKRKESILIGTSAPRRLENVPPFLSQALPRFHHGDQGPPELEMVEIRGNVQTRLGRIYKSSDKQTIDGVVLALAGIHRLYDSDEGRAILTPLLKDTLSMILPFSECPAAPAQGALLVECHSEDVIVQEILKRIHLPEVEKQVKLERGVLAEWGGGCHQPLGASSIDLPHLGNVLFIRGRRPDESIEQKILWDEPTPPSGETKIWNGNVWRNQIFETENLPLSSSALSTLKTESNLVWLAHSRVATQEVLPLLQETRNWTAGVQSWFRLAQKGLWVEGCSDGFGWNAIQDFFELSFLNLPRAKAWTILTHESAESEWSDYPKVFSPYRLKAKDDMSEAEKAANQSTHFFWSSQSQFELLKDTLPTQAHHASGPGRTATFLKSLNLENFNVFPNSESWVNWTKKRGK